MRKKGFTLVELLITITLISIIIAIAITTILKLNKNNKYKQYEIQSDSLLASAKLYNDTYNMDTFGNKEYGCAIVTYSALRQKNLIANIGNSLDCGYQVNSKDTSGVIIRKVKNKYYYETVLFCNDGKQEKNEINDYVEGNSKKYLYNLGTGYCNELASTDNKAPTVLYKNTNFKPGHFYNSINLPQLYIKISDDVTGLNSSEEVTYIWGSDTTNQNMKFTQPKGSGTTRWRNINLNSKIKATDSNYEENIKVIPKNVTDLALNVTERKLVNGSDDLTNAPGYTLKDSNNVNNTGTFYIDNTKPSLTVNNDVDWTNQSINLSIKVEDKLPSGSTVRSGIKDYSYKMTNSYTDTGNEFEKNVSTTEPKNLSNGNNSNQSGSNGIYNYSTTINKNGNYTLNATVTDWAGNSRSATRTYKYDGSKPTCGTISISNKKVVVKCNDQTGLSGCVSSTYSKSYPANGGNVDIEIKDNATNSNTCSATVYILTYNMKGGTGCTNEVKFKNENWGTICTPTKKGYEFQGWKDSNGNNVTRLGKATKSLDLTAQWKLTKPYYNDFGGYYEKLQNAINKTPSGTIHLVQNYNDSSSAVLNDSSKTLTFSVEGHTLNLTEGNIEVKAGTLTVKNGRINTSTTDKSAIVVSGGKLNIVNGITIHCNKITNTEFGTQAITISGGTINMSGGTISSGEGNNSGYAKAVHMTGGRFNMTGGKIIANATKNSGYGGTGINNSGGTVVMSGGTIESKKGGIRRCGICANSGHSYIKKGATIKIDDHVSNGNAPAVLWAGSGKICYEKGVSLTCTGATRCVSNSSNISKKNNGKCNP